MDELAQQFAIVQINKVLIGGPPIFAALVVSPMTLASIKLAQEKDPELRGHMERANHGKVSNFYFSRDGILKTKDGRTIVTNNAELRRKILDEAYQTKYMVHPSNTKGLWGNFTR